MAPHGIRILVALRELMRSLGRKPSDEEAAEVIDGYLAEHFPEKKITRPLGKQADEEWLSNLESEPTLAGIDIRRELAKAQFWCKQHTRDCTRLFFLRWLSKADRTIGVRPRHRIEAPAAPRTPAPQGWADFMRRKQVAWSLANPGPYDPPNARFFETDPTAYYRFPLSWRQECETAAAKAKIVPFNQDSLSG